MRGKWVFVPVMLFDEIESPEPDMALALRFGEVAVFGGRGCMLTIDSKQVFDDKHFSRHKLAIMDELAQKYKDTSAWLIRLAFVPNSPKKIGILSLGNLINTHFYRLAA